MKTSIKKISSLVLVLAMLLTMSLQSFGASAATWDDVFYSADADAGIIMFAGSNESERGFSWYTATQGVPSVKVSENKDLSNAATFSGTSLKAPDGDYANKVTVTGLKENTTYYYRCEGAGFTSSVYSFKTAGGYEFSAMYVTDIHITKDDTENPDSLKDSAEKFSKVYAEACEKNSNISLILSAGDQATQGLECEYKALTAGENLKSVSFATTMGNHDRKGIAYKTFKNVPNEDKDANIISYNGSDYWFVKGNALFLVMDSNSGNGQSHAEFIRKAIELNPDVKWKIMMCHHDLYSGRIPHRESENQFLRMLWGPIADEFGIDLVLLGHSHYYTVTNVLFNGKTVSDLEPQMTNPEGTVYMVSCSVTRPRNDAEIGLNEEWIGADYLTNKATYNILDFTEDTVTVNSYEEGSKKPFNSFTITKTSEDGGHGEISMFAEIKNLFVRLVGMIYTYFNNYSIYFELKEKGYDVSFIEVVMGNSNKF